MADSDDDWEKEDVPVVLNKAATKNDEDIDLTVLELEAAAAAVPSLPSGPTEAQKLREEVCPFLLSFSRVLCFYLSFSCRVNLSSFVRR